ncbi:MAG: biotin--[acetyl-CoA-carboxylase] ligase [Pseudomonadota bacterium]
MSTEAKRVWPEGYDRIVLDTVDSTNAQAARIAHELRGPTWIVARAQTGGHGRRGRPWVTGQGNLAATLVLRPTGSALDAALRSFLAANALFEALAMYVDRTHLSVKWPNDVLYRSGKIAGILLESMTQGGRIDWLSIGIGVNLAQAPAMREPDMIRPVSLSDFDGPSVDPLDFLDTLADCYATQERIFETMGFQPIRESWLENAARLGEAITARTMRDTIEGRFETVDEAGNLILETPKGRVTITAADVYF